MKVGQHDHIPPARVGARIGTKLELWGSCWVRKGFWIPTCWYWQREILMLGFMPNAMPYANSRSGVIKWEMGKSRVRNFLRPPPPQDRVKLFAPPPPFKEWKLFASPYNMAKTSSYRVKTTPKLFAPPPSAWLKLFPPPPLFVGVKLHVPPPPVL